jgi:hypothetical protein
MTHSGRNSSILPEINDCPIPLKSVEVQLAIDEVQKASVKLSIDKMRHSW